MFDTFGPVKCPFYSIRLSERIHSDEVKKQADVFFVPYNQNLTKYVFVEDLKKYGFCYENFQFFSLNKFLQKDLIQISLAFVFYS